jgi:CBS domain-containing protein
VDIAGFLRRYPPFADLDPERLEAVARSVEIEHVAEGTTILSREGDPATALYVIRKGAVELTDDGRPLDVLGEGEVFGQFSLLAHDRPSSTVRAVEDTLCYLIPAALAEEVLGTEPGRGFVLRSMRRRLSAASERAAIPQDDEHDDGRYRPVSSLLRRPPVTIRADAPVIEAARTMAAERVSSLLIEDERGLGILTDRDLRTRVVAAEADVAGPVAAVATFPAVTIPADTLAGDALVRMFADGVHHLPVVDATGELIGVVTDTDLMGLGRHTPFALRSAIERAADPAEVAAAGADLPPVVVAMVESHAEPVEVGRVIALAIDTMTQRLLRLAVDRLGEPPVAWAWLALGSAARHEQALRTDQDHALVLDCTVDEAPAVDPYFAALAEEVTAGLEAAGIPRCAGDAMATVPMMRAPLSEWVRRFETWMNDPTISSGTLSAIGYDFRRIAGPLDAEPPLDDAVREAAARPGFVRFLARRTLDLRPPTGLRGNLVLDRDREHAGTLDVKHGGITIVTNLARVFAVRASSSRKATIPRLEAAAAAGVTTPELAHELTDAFTYLWEIRLRHQANQVRAGEPPDDHVDPAALSAFGRSGVKEAFRVIARTQRTVAAEPGVDVH